MNAADEAHSTRTERSLIVTEECAGACKSYCQVIGINCCAEISSGHRRCILSAENAEDKACAVYDGDYQPGDPLSRVHWAQTAKRGRLQTKELRAPSGSGRTVVVLLDDIPLEKAHGRLMAEGVRDIRHVHNEAELPELCGHQVYLF